MSNYNDSRFPGPDPYAPLKDLPTFTLTSTDIVDGEKLSEALVGDDATSPQLAWSDLPEGTKSLAVTCFDPDAPTASGFWHWSVFNIPVSVTELPSGAGAKEDLGVGAVTLTGDSGVTAFYGANPPEGHGPHRYLFAVHAVDVEELPADEIANPTQLGFNLYFHSIGRAILWGWYEN
ncbi:YbhB/YbcL family Raf kinase inhibitor-like protein [Corynebacterium sanguinis]|uniref:YbhB/YbcL family Raf kinase inhibitor-like protein n=1 Tax=Corynebacterium sanguinis TaxID=2594913 RepID=A0A6C1TXJ1_9CORY|nr:MULTISPECIES: YbhB/YbcL family Raf kinase inhibitor-like protein [Corynebacterium]MCT1411178.1 YbhB/YbcL family Raf kinase inhibitor-like protein [Corynebacterium sanguinis]MCT1425609.1 YbhB/YbcL family Raf kinase inhibitor-like protein [Corynebacterium sanguinis]MCT1444736.1 YbhB/YbcL family Raf kinase inhibitor-like protein [Corynebacterium sanguinis]MCT1464041.1 YbhB/YbcL family Raf kinase inhibitor-like protein [Corynebacterium sanguinis]MCT1492708.1 YbhB/YbcL family Raf kinase inhibito